MATSKPTTRLQSRLAKNDENKPLSGKSLIENMSKAKPTTAVNRKRQPLKALSDNLSVDENAQPAKKQKIQPTKMIPTVTIQPAPAQIATSRPSTVRPRPTSKLSLVNKKRKSDDVTHSEPVESSRMSLTFTGQADLSAMAEDTNSSLDTLQEMEESQIMSPQNAFSLLPAGVTDVDSEDKDDPQLMSEYVIEIIRYWKAKEEQEKLNINHLLSQKEITPSMREKLINWLMEVQLVFRLLIDTMFLAVSIIDRYSQCTQIPRNKYQLVGMTSLFIAAKVEEIWAVGVEQFVFICKEAYSKEEILQMEQDILRALQFNVTPPTSISFLRRYTKVSQADAQTHTLAKYLIELSLPNYALSVGYVPSQIAAASVYLSRKMIANCENDGETPHDWDATMVYYTGYTENDILACVQEMNGLVTRSFNEMLTKINQIDEVCVITKKYLSSKFGAVAKIAPIHL